MREQQNEGCPSEVSLHNTNLRHRAVITAITFAGLLDHARPFLIFRLNTEEGPQDDLFGGRGRAQETEDEQSLCCLRGGRMQERHLERKQGGRTKTTWRWQSCGHRGLTARSQTAWARRLRGGHRQV